MNRISSKIVKPIALAAVAALALGLSACGEDGTGPDSTPAPTVDVTTEAATPEATADEAVTEETTTQEATPTEDVATEDSQAPADPVGGDLDDVTAAALTAIQTAESETGGTAYSIDDKDDDRRWEVEVALDGLEVEVTLSADGTTVERTEDDDDLDADERQALQDMQVGLVEAIEIAHAQFGGVLDDADLEEDDGRWTWEIDLGGANDDIHVDIVTGEIVTN